MLGWTSIHRLWTSVPSLREVQLVCIPQRPSIPFNLVDAVGHAVGGAAGLEGQDIGRQERSLRPDLPRLLFGTPPPRAHKLGGMRVGALAGWDSGVSGGRLDA